MQLKSFTPLITVFGTSLLITITLIKSFQVFMGILICLLAMLKLMDIEAFGLSYKKYDWIISRFKSWIYIYPFCELLIGICFLLSAPPSTVILIAFILGIIGMVSVLKTVYLDNLKLNCVRVENIQKLLWQLLVLLKIF